MTLKTYGKQNPFKLLISRLFKVRNGFIPINVTYGLKRELKRKGLLN